MRTRHTLYLTCLTCITLHTAGCSPGSLLIDAPARASSTPEVASTPPQTAPDAPPAPSSALHPPTPQAQPEPSPFWQRWRARMARPPYALDEYSRMAERNPKGRLICPDVETVRYKGTTLKYHKPMRIARTFQPTLARFEEIVAQVAMEVYGRVPSKIIHYGTYNCRTIRTRKYRLSEHAFGNAIDIAGFEFKRLPKKQRKQLAIPKAGRRFRVSVEKHWDDEKGFSANHAVFLKRLTLRLMNESVFRGLIVPPAPGHKNHLHLDMGRWSYLRGDPFTGTPQS